MRHLITGGSGFLGNLIARKLLEQGERVTVLDIWEDPSRPREIEFVHCDVRNEDGVAAAMRGIDVVHHNAALVPLTKSGRDFETVNTEGSRIAARAAAATGVKAFIHMSSSAVYGSPKCPITGETPLRPVEAYGRAKLAGEMAVREICGKTGMPLIVIRPRTILGLGRLGIFQILFDWIRENRDVWVIGSGDIRFQFVQASDLIDAYLLALERQTPGVYNVGTDRYGTLREALTRLIAYAGSTSRVRSLPQTLTIQTLRTLDVLGLSPLAPWHYLTYHKEFFFDIQPLLALGWKPKYSNDEMFRESYDWFLAHPNAAKDDATKSPHRHKVKEGALWLLRKLS